MPFVTRKSLLTLGVLSGLALATVTGFIWSGIYNIGADDQHTRPVYAVLETLRERSIEARASNLDVPDLTDAALIRQGAGNYDSMCTGCHLAPGMESTELSRGLYPAPPAFSTAKKGNPAHHFWVIKHGIKASGMPAWGMSMNDQYIWGMVAFVQQLPDLDAEEYRALVARSGGHSHGGGETPAHGDAEASPDHHGDAATNKPAAAIQPIDESKPHAHAPGTSPHSPSVVPATGAGTTEKSEPKTMTHRHADGTVESHPVETEEPSDEASEDDHEHQH
jgi:mono/diheme cytochrome c family protein